MPTLRRKPSAPEPPPEPPVVARVPWDLPALLRDGPEEIEMRRAYSERLEVVIVRPPGPEPGIPAELLRALEDRDLRVQWIDAEDAHRAADADVLLALGWPAAPAVLRVAGVRARAVLATTAPAPLAELGWTEDVPVIGPTWMGGDLPAGADAVFAPMPVQRREDLVLVHGEDPLGLLVAADLHARREDLSFAISGARARLELPFPFLGVEPGPAALAHAFASATVAIAPAVRGWRPAATAMLACGQAVVAPDDAASRTALGDAATLAAGPLEAAAAVEELLGDLELRARRARAGFARVERGWASMAAAVETRLRALPPP